MTGLTTPESAPGTRHKLSITLPTIQTLINYTKGKCNMGTSLYEKHL